MNKSTVSDPAAQMAGLNLQLLGFVDCSFAFGVGHPMISSTIIIKSTPFAAAFAQAKIAIIDVQYCSLCHHF
jgi:hypothetical protein